MLTAIPWCILRWGQPARVRKTRIPSIWSGGVFWGWMVPRNRSAEPAQSIVASLPTKTYHIIVASLPNRRGADETLAQYAQQGYASASLVERDDRVRISLMQFTDKDEANEQLKALRQQEKFQSAWLLAVRN